ncbi:hypothetical protein L7F22_052972, partial [Adiantum nelumboides]|nr:hypothetical protein [Adiantum nelumboides]
MSKEAKEMESNISSKPYSMPVVIVKLLAAGGGAGKGDVGPDLGGGDSCTFFPK